MGANLIKLNGNTILDLTGDTVTEADVRDGVSFHKRNG
jgi:NDP-sugar pyrophosphorylase family protein